VLLQNVHIWVAQQPVCRQAGEGIAGGGWCALSELAGATWNLSILPALIASMQPAASIHHV
jgi:hypothetical protein